MSEIITESDEKLAKTKVIDGMLSELEMSKQELIDLIKVLTEQSISTDKSSEISTSQNISEKKLALQNNESKELPENISIEQLAQMAVAGNTEILTKYLTLQQLKDLSIRVGLTYSLKRAIELGIALDHDKISSQIGIPGFSKFLFNGKMIIGGKEKTLSGDQAAKASSEVNKSINEFMTIASRMQAKQYSTQSGVSIDLNSSSNPASVQNLVSKIASIIRMQVQVMGGSLSQMLNSGAAMVLNQRNNLNEKTEKDLTTDNPQLQPETQPDASQQQNNPPQNQTAEQAKPKESKKSKNKSKGEKNKSEKPKSNDKFKNILSGGADARSNRRRNRDVTAIIKTNDGIMVEINLRQMLLDNNKLTPQTEQMLENIINKNIKFETGLNELLQLIPNAKNIQLDENNRIQIQIESKEDLKSLKLTDVLTEGKKKDERRQKRRETRREERRAVRKMNAETSKIKAEYDNKNANEIERSKEQTRGPELDKQIPNAETDITKAMAEETMLRMQKSVDISGEKRDTTSKEIKRNQDELIKLDALHDKLKLLKESQEVDGIKESVGKVMEAMPEAEKNKNMLADMKKELQKNRFLDKI